MNWSNEWGKSINHAKREMDLASGIEEYKPPNVIPALHIGTSIGTFGWDAKLTIRDGNIKRIATVEIIGDLALEFDDTGWCMYHVPTLSKFDKAVPGYPYDIQITRIEPISGDIQDSNVKWISKEECEAKWPSDNKEHLSYEYDEQHLLNWMKKVQENYPTSWTMLRCLTPDNYKDKGQSAKDIIQKWCLSVKVE